MKNTISIGNSGEYFVAAELERRGFTAALPMSNAKDFDVLAISRETARKVAIQVKTEQGASGEWILSKKCEQIKDKDVYFVFVSLNGKAFPSYYIVESSLVADNVRDGYAKWIKEGEHKETTMRKFTFKTAPYDNIHGLKAEEFKDKWDKLK